MVGQGGDGLRSKLAVMVGWGGGERGTLQAHHWHLREGVRLHGGLYPGAAVRELFRNDAAICGGRRVHGMRVGARSRCGWERGCGGRWRWAWLAGGRGRRQREAAEVPTEGVHAWAAVVLRNAGGYEGVGRGSLTSGQGWYSSTSSTRSRNSMDKHVQPTYCAFTRPSSHASWKMSCGNAIERSYSAAWGMITSLVKVLAMS